LERRRRLLERLALIARLRPGADERAAELIAGGPPFDPEESGFLRHSIYLASGEVVFVFEGHEVEGLIGKLVDDPLHWMLREAIDEWAPLLEKPPGVAREKYFWESPQPQRKD
jgi:hypothetical protein